MMKLIEVALAVVTALLCSFGSYTLAIAPPEPGDIALLSGGLSVLVLALYLFLQSSFEQSQNKAKFRKMAWAGGGLSIVASLFLLVSFIGMSEQLIIYYPKEETAPEYRYVVGEKLMPDAEKYLAIQPSLSKSELLSKFGGPANMSGVWSEDSIKESRTKLAWLYLGFGLCLQFSLLSLIFSIFRPADQADAVKPPADKDKEAENTKENEKKPTLADSPADPSANSPQPPSPQV